jgi:hypothetical protein
MALVLVLTLLFGALPAAAAETGTCGENLTWSYADGVLTVTGEGAMEDYLEGAPWAHYQNEIHTLVFTGGVTYIGAYAFRDYDALPADKPTYSPPYIHKTQKGQRVSFQTWDWQDDIYRLTQYIIDDQGVPTVSKFDCALRAVCRKEVTDLLLAHGCQDVMWKFPEETAFYQPIVIARKK